MNSSNFYCIYFNKLRIFKQHIFVAFGVENTKEEIVFILLCTTVIYNYFCLLSNLHPLCLVSCFFQEYYLLLTWSLKHNLLFIFSIGFNLHVVFTVLLKHSFIVKWKMILQLLLSPCGIRNISSVTCKIWKF